MPIASGAWELLRPYYLRWVYFRRYPSARPPHFAACWRYPNAPIGELPRPSTDRAGVVFFPMNDWHTRFQRTQQLAAALSRQGYRCLYLNPHLGRQFDRVRFQAPQHRLGVLGDDLFELHVRLPREPVFHHRLLTAAETATVQDAVAAALDALRITPAMQVVSFPLWLDAASALRRMRGLPLVYDCHDLLGGFANIAPEIVEAEERRLREADLVAFSSESLRERFGAHHPELAGRSIVVRNAVDFERFSAVPEPPSGSDSAVYAGALEGWFDVNAVRAAARGNPECRISLIGRVDAPHVRQLATEPNISFIGEVDYARLPSLLRQSRVGLIPFEVNPLTLATNPIKLYEYFSLGLPVVSSALPEVARFGDLVYIASDSAGFAAALRDALREQDAARRLRRIAVARAETWEARALVLSTEFRRLLAHRLPGHSVE